MKKTLFTNDDIQSFKSALSSYSAKEKALIEKYSRWLDDYESKEKALTIYESVNSGSMCYLYRCKIQLIRRVIEDLRTPADMFLTDFDMKGCI